MTITVVIPTCNRAESLARAVASVQAQAVDPEVVDVVVVDNHPAGSSRDAADVLAGPLTIRHVTEPVRGVAAARNRGIAEARGELIAFLDDDQEAAPGWLAALTAAMDDERVDAAFGAVAPLFATRPAPHALALAGRIFSRRLGAEARDITGPAVSLLGTGNSVFRRRCFDVQPGFDNRMGLTGGEDAVLIASMAAAGATLRWCPAAMALEHVPPQRVTPGALLWRRFSEGQTRTAAAAAAAGGDITVIGRWMAIGSAQTMVSLLRALIIWDPARRLSVLGEAASGLGKVLWHGRFRLNRALWPGRIVLGHRAGVRAVNKEPLVDGPVPGGTVPGGTVPGGMVPGAMGPGGAAGIGRLATVVRRARSMVAWRLAARRCRSAVLAPMVLPPGARFASFCFDDFPDSAATEGAPLLERHGARGTFYGAFGAFPQATESVEHLRRRGHEVGCHTFGHLDVRTTPQHDLAGDLDRNEERSGQALVQFAFPFGLEDLASRHALRHRFDGMRTAYAGSIEPNAPFDATALPAYELSGRWAHKVRAERALRHVIDQGGWAIFFTHGVTDGATASSADRYELERMVAMATKAGVDVVPVGEVLRRSRTTTRTTDH